MSTTTLCAAGPRDASASLYRLDQYGHGRFHVLSAVAGVRAGDLIGAAGHWAAELPNGDSIGRFASRDAGARALLSARGLPSQTFFEQMRDFIEGPEAPLLHYKDDFYVHDRAYLECWNNATDLLWFVSKNATHLVPLDLDQISMRETEAVLQARDPQLTGTPLHIRLLDVATGRIRPCDAAYAASRGREKPRYRKVGSSIYDRETLLGSMAMRTIPRACQMPAAEVTVQMSRAPTRQEQSVIKRLAACQPVQTFGTLFAKLNRLTIVVGSEVHYDSEAA